MTQFNQGQGELLNDSRASLPFSAQGLLIQQVVIPPFQGQQIELYDLE